MTEEAKFEKVTRTAKILYGPRKLLLCGFPAAARAKFEDLLALSGLPDVPRVWAADGHAEAPILELFGLPDGSGVDEPSGLPRAVIVGGITEAELIGLMGACRKSGMAPALWAVLTPVSEKWALRQLLEELARERDRLQQNKK